MAWHDNPGFGIYTDEDYSDSNPTRPSFGVTPTQNDGEGIWCPDCRKDGKYTWLDFVEKTKDIEIYQVCPIHKKQYTKKRRLDIKKGGEEC